MKSRNVFLLVAEIAILLTILFTANWLERDRSFFIDLLWENWSSQGATYIDRNWLFDDEKGEIKSPFLSIPKGSYTLEINYKAENEQELQFNAPEGMDAFLDAGTIRLVTHKNQVLYRFKVKEGMDSFQIIIPKNKTGRFDVFSLVIKRNRDDVRECAAIFGILFFLIDIIFLLNRKCKWEKETLIVLFGIVFVISLPLFINGIHQGHDIRFHFLRIEGIAAELRNGVFPVRIASTWFDGFGYAIPIYYGDFLLYFPAALRLMGVPIVTAFKLFVIALNLGTVIIAYACFRKMVTRNSVAIVMTLAYTTATYRFLDIYLRMAIGESSAFVFYPVIALALFQMYTSASNTLNEVLENSALLSIGISGILCSHLLSAEITMIGLAVFILFNIKRSINKKIIITFLLAAFGTIILSAFFLIPFFDYYIHVPVTITGALSGGKLRLIQQYGAYIGQYFSFFEKLIGFHSNQVNIRFSLTPGPVLMGAFVMGAAFFKDKGNKKAKMLWGISLVFLLLASDLFPWNVLALRTHLGRILSQVQFPWRYLGLALLAETLLLGEVLLHLENRARFVYAMELCVILSLMTVSINTSYYLNDANIIRPVDTAELNTNLAMDYEYWINGADGELNTGEVEHSQLSRYRLLEHQGLKYIFEFETQTDAVVVLPLQGYPYYKAVDMEGNIYQVTDEVNKQVCIQIPQGKKGTMIVNYVEPVHWRVAECISAVAVMGVILLFGRSKSREYFIINQNAFNDAVGHIFYKKW